jgi:hypothetical protein
MAVERHREPRRERQRPHTVVGLRTLLALAPGELLADI